MSKTHLFVTDTYETEKDFSTLAYRQERRKQREAILAIEDVELSAKLHNEWKAIGEKINARRYRAKFPEKRLHHAAMGNAKQKGVPFNLDVEDIKIPEVCPVFHKSFEQRTPMAASIDRIDPTKGYVKGNIQIISKKANLMKQDASVDELKQFAEWVLKNA